MRIRWEIRCQSDLPDGVWKVSHHTSRERLRMYYCSAVRGGFVDAVAVVVVVVVVS